MKIQSIRNVAKNLSTTNCDLHCTIANKFLKKLAFQTRKKGKNVICKQHINK